MMPKTLLRYVGLSVLFVVLTILFWAWSTGFTFTSSEVRGYPTHAMLAESFATGRLDIEECTAEDMATINGKHYVYWGPVPALVRLPVRLLLGTSIPSGVMIALYCAGVCVFFILLLTEIAAASESRLKGSALIVMSVAFVFSGTLWFMTVVPSVHHETICAEVFFLVVALYYSIKVLRNGFAVSPLQALVIGTSVALAFGTRLIAVVTAAFVIAVILLGIHFGRSRSGIFIRWISSVLLTIPSPIVGCLLMWYNYARFGSVTEVGHKYCKSFYTEYALKGHAFRYEHIPFNVWDYFFRIPEARPGFPFIDIRVYIWDVFSRADPTFHLIHFNELVVSIFWIMPITVFALIPLSDRLSAARPFDVSAYRFTAGVFVAQTVTLLLFMGSAARYVFDFLPFLMTMAYIGVISLRWDERVVLVPVVFTAVLSVLFGILYLSNSFSNYFPFLPFQPPGFHF